eukprot:m.225615 g.225615  ORF g.225615 m.225615 type:complete len:305 (+) comp17311_c0_seq4:202-1116(+)
MSERPFSELSALFSEEDFEISNGFVEVLLTITHQASVLPLTVTELHAEQLAILRAGFAVQSCVVQAPTGVGKTLALCLIPVGMSILAAAHGFVIPSDQLSVACLYVYPLECLRHSVLAIFEQLSSHSDIIVLDTLEGIQTAIRTHAVYGTSSVVVLLPSARELPEVLKVVQALWQEHLAVCVVDEVHLCLDWGNDFRDELDEGMSGLVDCSAPVMFVSATVSDTHFITLESMFGKLIKLVWPCEREDIRFASLSRLQRFSAFELSSHSRLTTQYHRCQEPDWNSVEQVLRATERSEVLNVRSLQ